MKNKPFIEDLHRILEELNEGRHLAVKAIEKLLDEAYERGRRDLFEELKHGTEKLLDGFGHASDCAMCNEKKICQ